MRELLTQPTAFITALTLGCTVILVAVWALIRVRPRHASLPTKDANATTGYPVRAHRNTAHPGSPQQTDSGPLADEDGSDLRLTSFVATADNTEVEEVDALEEAEIFLSYGHYEAAANILSWYVQNNPQDTNSFRQLLSVYLELDDAASYTAVLETYVDHHGLTRAADAIADGMMQFPDNPLIRGLAQGAAGVDSATMDELMPEPVEEDERPEEPEPRVQNASIIPFSGARSRSRVPEPKPEPQESVALVNFQPEVGRLNILEKLTLRSFQAVNEVDELELGIQGFEATTRGLQWQIAEDPHHLNNYVELLTRYHRLGDVGAYARVMWRLFWMMGDKGYSLRKRMLQHGLQLGRHPVLHGLVKVLLGETTLERLAWRLRLEPVHEFVQIEDLPLVSPADGEHGADRKKTPEDKLLTNAVEMVEYGQADYALSALEKALFSDPEQLALYPVLLDLYVHSRDTARFETFQQRIFGGDVQPPLDVILKIVDTGKEMEAHALRTGT